MKVYSGQKILVVEDNFMSYKLMEVYFSRVNLTIVHASDGLTALSLFKANPYIELVLMDIQLPGMSGLDVTKNIRKFNQNIPVIATTGNVFDDDRTACMEAGCTYYVTKPINFPELFTILDKYLT
jgi:two-component system, cell cycle response regulator DivK